MPEVTAWTIAVFVAHLLIIAFATVSISANRNPSSAIAWVLVIAFVPALGIVAYLLIGTAKLPAERRRKQQYVTDHLLTRDDGTMTRAGRSNTWPDWLPTLTRMNRTLGALPMLPDNHVELIGDYSAMIEAIAADIDRAEHYVHVEFFILVRDETTAPFFAALQRACERGVQVRVLSDHLSVLTYPNRRETLDAFTRMGAEFHAMLPISPLRARRRIDLRNHRKLVVIDGRIGHTGSMNMIADNYHKAKALREGLHWQELMMRMQGPVVRELDAVFATDWYSETDELPDLDYQPAPATGRPLVDAQVLPSGPSFANDNNLKLFAAAIHNARRRISVTSPYFVPDDSIQKAMITAASRGLEVELFVSEISDQFMVYHAQRSYYEELLRAGVQVYLYHAPTVLHAKHISIDDDVAIIGTSNMDIRSLSLHMELMVLLASRPLVRDLRRVEDSYRQASSLLTLAEWLQRPRRQRWLDNGMRLTSALM